MDFAVHEQPQDFPPWCRIFQELKYFLSVQYFLSIYKVFKLKDKRIFAFPICVQDFRFHDIAESSHAFEYFIGVSIAHFQIILF